jgi:hypothetical protein
MKKINRITQLTAEQKERLIKEAGAGTVFWNAAKGLGNSLWSGTKAVTSPFRWGAKKGLGWYGSKMKAHPIAGTLSTLGVAATAPYLFSQARGAGYFPRLAQRHLNPYQTQNFGTRTSGGGFFKMNSDKNIMKKLEKIGAFEKESIANPFRVNINPLRGVQDVMRRFQDKGDILMAAAIPTIGIPLVNKLLGPSAETVGKSLERKLFPAESRLGLSDVELAEEAKARAKTIGMENAQKLLAAHSAGELAQAETLTHTPAREAILNTLKTEDPLIGAAMVDPTQKKIIDDTMTTLKAFAPTLSLNKNTVKSVLREALTSPEGGMSYQTIKQLAETQKSVSESGDAPILTI